MNVDKVVEASEEPLNKVLADVQFSLHALTEDLQHTASVLVDSVGICWPRVSGLQPFVGLNNCSAYILRC